MAAGDVHVYTGTPDKIDALLTGNVVVADSIAMCAVNGGMVCVVVVKAA